MTSESVVSELQRRYETTNMEEVVEWRHKSMKQKCWTHLAKVDAETLEKQPLCSRKGARDGVQMNPMQIGLLDVSQFNKSAS